MEGDEVEVVLGEDEEERISALAAARGVSREVVIKAVIEAGLAAEERRAEGEQA